MWLKSSRNGLFGGNDKYCILQERIKINADRIKSLEIGRKELFNMISEVKEQQARMELEICEKLAELKTLISVKK